MPRVIAARVHLATWVLISACAPSLPHPPGNRAADDDAAVDQAAAIPEVPSAAPRDATIKDLPASPDAPIRDAASESTSFRDTRAPDAREARPPDASADPDPDAGADVRVDAAADARPDAHTDQAGDADDAAAVPPPKPGDLRITELLINPAGADTNREWIEILNLAPQAVDLRLLTVADAAGEVAVDAGVLDPGAILVLGQSLDPARNGGAPVGFSFGNVISLNNGGDLIRLCLGPCAGGAVIAELSWAADLGASFDGHAAVVGISADPRGDSDGGDGGDSGAAGAPVFCPADQPFGTAGSFGRPGLPDPPCPD